MREDYNNHGQPRLVYDEAKSSIFRNQLSTCDCVLSQLIDNVNIGHVDSIVQSFTNFVYDCAACAYCKTGEGKINKVTKPKNLWFDDKCIQASVTYRSFNHCDQHGPLCTQDRQCLARHT